MCSEVLGMDSMDGRTLIRFVHEMNTAKERLADESDRMPDKELYVQSNCDLLFKTTGIVSSVGGGREA